MCSVPSSQYVPFQFPHVFYNDDGNWNNVFYTDVLKPEKPVDERSS